MRFEVLVINFDSFDASVWKQIGCDFVIEDWNVLARKVLIENSLVDIQRHRRR